MYGKILVGGICLHKWGIALVILEAIIIILIAISWSKVEWVYTKFDKTVTYDDSNPDRPGVFKGLIFSGGVSSCYYGCNRLISYSSLKDSMCSLNSSDSDSDSLCVLFGNLTKANYAKVALDIVSYVLLGFWFKSKVLLHRGRNAFVYSFIVGPLSYFCYMLGSFIWYGIMRTSFGDCKNYPSDGSAAPVCASTGPSLVIAVMIIYSITIILFSIVFAIAYSRRPNFEVPSSQNNNVDAVPPVSPPQAQIINIPFAKSEGVSQAPNTLNNTRNAYEESHDIIYPQPVGYNSNVPPYPYPGYPPSVPQGYYQYPGGANLNVPYPQPVYYPPEVGVNSNNESNLKDAPDEDIPDVSSGEDHGSKESGENIKNRNSSESSESSESSVSSGRKHR